MNDTLVTPEALDETTAKSVQRLILTLADSKRLMGIRYSDWLLGAPSIETGIAASSMAQDEWGHARLLYSLLKAFDIDPVEVEHDRAPEQYASLAALDEPMPDWAALVAAMVVADGALTAMLASFAEGGYEPARARIPKMLSEEEFHASLGAAWYKRLAASEEAKALLVDATMSMLPTTVGWLTVDDDVNQALVDAGLLEPGPTRLARFTDAVGEVLSAAAVDPLGFEFAGEWDADRGRTEGHPDEESIVRARGDKNRALFVE